MPDVFLSYSRQDQAQAHTFAEALAAEGWEVWWDVGLRAGDAYDEVTEAALRQARAVVVLWSKTSVASRWVRSEATLADRNRTLAPAMIEPCERPIMFELTQTADLIGWQGSRADPAWRAFVADVRGLMDHAAHPPGANAEPAIAPVAPPGRPTHKIACLAVMPFSNRSGLPEDEAFAYGMAEDVIEAMSRGAAVKALSSSATAAFRKDGPPDLEGMARMLGVRYVLEGNVRRVGQDLRVTTQLVQAPDGAVVWSRKFNKPVAQLAELQEQLVLEVAGHLKAETHKREIERALRKPGDLTAYEALMRAEAALRHLDRSSLAQGLREARRAVKIDPEYGLAIALVAQAEGMIYSVAVPDNPAEAARIRADAERAVSLDPHRSSVLTMAATALHNVNFFRESLALAQRAVQLNPANEFAYLTLGAVLCKLDRCEEALAALETEAALSPGHLARWQSLMWRGFSQLGLGDWDAGLATFEALLAQAPDSAAGNILRAICLQRAGRTDEAITAFRAGRRFEPDTTLELWEMRFTRAYGRNRAKDEINAAVRTLWIETTVDAPELTS